MIELFGADMNRMPEYQDGRAMNYIRRTLDNLGTGAKLIVPPIVGIAGGYLAGAAVDSIGNVGTVPYFNDFCHGVANLFRAAGVIGGVGIGIGLAYADMRNRIERAGRERPLGREPRIRRRRR